MIPKLQFTSTLFSTVVLHAYAKQDANLHFLCLMVTMSSIANHSASNWYIRTIDMIFAHALCGYAAINLAIMWDPLVFLVGIVAVIWGLEKYACVPDSVSINLHAVLHIVAVVGLHLYLYHC